MVVICPPHLPVFYHVHTYLPVRVHMCVYVNGWVSRSDTIYLTIYGAVVLSGIVNIFVFCKRATAYFYDPLLFG